MSPAKAYIFDMDGVLIHSSDIHRRAFAETLAATGVPLGDYGEIAGMRTDAAFDHIFRRAGIVLDEAERAALVAAKRELALRLLEAECPVDPHCTRVLTTLHQRGHRLALASSASAESVRLFLRLSSTDALFEAVLSGDDVGDAKPHPEIYLTAAERLGLAACDCIVVEDSRSGVEAGRRAGATVIGLAGGTTPDVLTEAGADRVIRSLDELIDLQTEVQ